MKAILQSIYCLPCVWTGLALVVGVLVASYFQNTWVPAKGPLPSDGPAEGFPNRAAMKAFYDTSGMRIRAAARAVVIVAGVWLVGVITLLVILKAR